MKVRPFKIVKPLEENLIVQVDKGKGFYNHLHQHNEIQLSFIVKGTGKLLVGDGIHPFTDGDFFGIGSNSPHLFKNENRNKPVHMVSIFFTENTLGEYFFQLPDLIELQPFFKFITEGFIPITHKYEIVGLMEQFPKSSKLSRVVLLLKLLKLCCDADKKPLTSFTYPKQTGSVAGERLQVVFDYILHNFHNEITLNYVANMVHMTPNAFCKFFKQRTNKTLFQFLIELRIEHASQLLREKKDVPIAEIADRSGFNSISNFNRKFIGIKGTTPTKFSKSVKK